MRTRLPHGLALLVLAPLGFPSSGCADVGLDALYVSGDAVLETDPTDEVDFGDVSPAGRATEAEVLFISSGVEPVAIVDVYLPDTTSEAFTIASDLSGFLPMRLNSDRPLTVKVDFAPYAAGDYSGEIAVWVDDGGEEVEVVLALHGHGCADGDEDGSCD